MRFDFTYTNDNLTINTTGAVEGSTTFQVEMGKVFKGDKGDRGTASYSPKIDSGTNTWWTWNDTTQGYIDTGIKAESTDLFLKKTNVIIYNITNEIPLGAGFFYTLSTAITATPVANRKKGLILMFESASGIIEAYQFKSIVANWTNQSYWENISPSLKIDKTAVSLYNITNEIPLPAGSYYTLATAMAAIPTNIRKLGLKITFQVSATNTETWEFFNGTIGNITNVAYWRKTANSTDLSLKIDKTAIKQVLGTSTTDVMSQKATTDAIMKAHDYDINFFAYGVARDLTGTGQTLTRVGNLSLHKTRPIITKVRGCVKNAQGVQYYLDNNTDFLKADGVTPSVLDGTDGDVMTEIPEMYVYEYTEGNYEYTYLSEFPLPNFKRIPKTYHGRYEGSYDTTTNQLRSVINASIRTGLPATGQSVFYYNSGAIKDRNLDWSPDRLLSHYVRELLFRVHYATYNSQATFNSALTAEGYLQGGLGAGVSDINANKWRYNGQNPFIPCGYTAELGNRTGGKDFYMPYEYDGWSSVTGNNTGYYKGIYNATTPYNVNEYVADAADSSIGKGDGKLYKCILTAPAGTALTNTTYFALQTRTKTQANRFLVEIPFGHIQKQTIDAIIEITGGGTSTKCYVYDNPAHFAPTKTANARFICNMPSAEGYIKLFNSYTIVPYSIGGSSGAWGYDYYEWQGAGGALRGLLFGGLAYYGSLTGLGCSYSLDSPSHAYTRIGVRLCNFPEGSNI